MPITIVLSLVRPNKSLLSTL